MKLIEFDYNLPDERIAQFPPTERGSTRLLVIDRKRETITHKKYSDVVDYIKPGDIVVLNNTKVQNARVFFNVVGKAKRVEALILDKFDNGNFHFLIGKGGKLKPGDKLQDEKGLGTPVEIVRKCSEVVGFEIKSEQENIDLIIMGEGRTPLPPYIKRPETKDDEIRYNTVFAQKLGSSASPTASINLTKELLKKLGSKGIKIVYVELKVGWGTFAPIREENVENHKIHREYIEIRKEIADEINEVIKKGGDVWAFGTTVSRTLETCSFEEEGKFLVKPFSGYTSLYITPRYTWKVVKHLVTNFHTPKSSLLVLVSSFMGHNLMKKAYNMALEKEYNFLSYGDSMLIL